MADRFYQLHKPSLPGLRGGEVVIEERLDGSMAIRFAPRQLKYSEVTGGACPGRGLELFSVRADKGAWRR